MVCSGRVPELQYEDDLFSETGDFSSNGEESELMSQLAALDGEDESNLEDFQRREILEALGIDPGESAGQANKEDDFLSEELFLDLEVQVGELEKMSKSRNDQLDSLRKEVEEADHQLAALGKVVDPAAGTQLASRTIDSPPRADRVTPFTGPKSDYQVYYEEALEDIYAHRYPQAIAKFHDLLRQPDTDNLADNCQYWIGEAYFAMGKFDMAIAEFEKVFIYDNNNKIDDAQFMSGMAYAKLGNSNLAKLELMHLMSFFQNSEYIPRAENQISDLRI
jgi:TolA-binding protein